MIKNMHQPCCKRQRRSDSHAVCLEGKSKAEPDENDADVFNSMISEQTFEIMLHQRIEYAHRGSDPADAKHRHAPPPGRRTEQIERNAHKTINRDFGHNAAHQCGDMTRCRRMSER